MVGTGPMLMDTQHPLRVFPLFGLSIVRFQFLFSSGLVFTSNCKKHLGSLGGVNLNVRKQLFVTAGNDSDDTPVISRAIQSQII